MTYSTNQEINLIIHITVGGGGGGNIFDRAFYKLILYNLVHRSAAGLCDNGYCIQGTAEDSLWDSKGYVHAGRHVCMVSRLQYILKGTISNGNGCVWIIFMPKHCSHQGRRFYGSAKKLVVPRGLLQCRIYFTPTLHSNSL